MHLPDIRHASSIAVFNSGKQGKVVHTLQFFRLSPLRKPGKMLVTPPPPPHHTYKSLARAACVAAAPLVKRLRALVGAEYGAFYRLKKGRLSPIVGSVRSARSCTIRDDRKGRRWSCFSGVGISVPNKHFAGVYILLPCLPRWFSVGLGFLPHMNIAKV